MRPITESDLTRLITGDLEGAEARAVERAIEEDPRLAERLGELRATWEGLAEPDFEPPGPEFERALLARLESTAETWDPWRSAGLLGRVAAAAALVAGIALGAGLGFGRRVEPELSELDPLTTLADQYLAALDALGERGESEGGRP